MSCKPNDDRAEDDLELTLGEVLRDERGQDHVFIGWRTNTAGRFPVFAKVQAGEWAWADWGTSVHFYHAAITSTLCRKFPELSARRRVSS